MTSTTTATTSDTSKSTESGQGDGSVLGKDDKGGEAKPQGPPEKYEFKAPEHWAKEGWELDTDVIEKATPIFKELGLSNDQAQKLVSFYTEVSEADHKASLSRVVEQNETWLKELKQDPEIGGKLDTVRANVSRMLDGLGDPALKEGFQAAMTETGMGNHPTFVRLFAKLSEHFTEPGPVRGRGPVEVKQPGAPSTLAAAMFPNLKQG